MCEGYSYRLVCGHQLIHVQTPCTSASKCQKLDGPERPLTDTCAQCDPSHRIAVLRRAYEAAHAQNMWEYEDAKRQGRLADAHEILGKDWCDLKEQNKGIAEAERLARLCSVDVAWPGKRMED
jgi:hypothetical protein